MRLQTFLAVLCNREVGLRKLGVRGNLVDVNTRQSLAKHKGIRSTELKTLKSESVTTRHAAR
jgi:hypothetical protein